MSSRIKICQYIPHGAIPDIRGFAPAIVAQNYALSIDKTEFDMYYISNKEDYKDFYQKTKYGNVYRIFESKIYKRLFKKITRLDPYPLEKRMAKILNKYPVDILHVHQIEFNINKFKKYLTKKIPKIIVHSHNFTHKYNSINGTADRYITLTQQSKTIMIQKGYPKEKIITITNSIDTNTFKPVADSQKISLKEKYDIDKDAIVISFIGRKQEVKGFEKFLFMAEKMILKNKNLVFISVGPEPFDTKYEKSYLEREQIRNKLSSLDNYKEFQPLKHKELAEIYQMTDITVLLSKREAQGMVMVESISSGCITISSNIDGILETIEDRYNGYLLTPEVNTDELIKKVEYILENFESKEIENIKKYGRQTATDKFDTSIITNKLQLLYKEIINE